MYTDSGDTIPGRLFWEWLPSHLFLLASEVTCPLRICVCVCLCKCFLASGPACMLTGSPLLWKERYGIPSYPSCGSDDASKKVEQPEGLAAAWPSADHCCGQEGDLAEKKSSHGWMRRSLTKFFSSQPLLNKQNGVVKAQRNTFSDIYLLPVSTNLFFLFVIFKLGSIYQITCLPVYFP